MRRGRSEGRVSLVAGVAIALALSATAALAAPLDPPAGSDQVDYLHAPFEVRHVLDWGDRPNWSPDGSRLVFTESDTQDGFAYQLDLQSGEVRCLTCRWGPRGLVTRIYHLPDSSFLIEAGQTGFLTTELYWMPASAAMPPQPLDAQASGEVAISPRITPDGGFRVAWSGVGTLGQMMTGELVHDGSRAAITNRRTIPTQRASADGPLGGYGETYDFARNDEALTFWGFAPALDGEMFEVDLRTGAVRRLYEDPSHNETHLFPDGRFGLEESNRASDPDGPVRGVSGLFASAPGVGGPFDLFVVALDGSNQIRRLTHVSDVGGQANQSVPAHDGRRVAFVLDAPSSGPYVGKGGLYVGEFLPRTGS